MRKRRALAAALGVFAIIMALIGVIVGILFLLTLQNTLKKVAT